MPVVLVLVAALATPLPQAAPREPPTPPITPTPRLRIDGSVRVRVETIAGQARVGVNDGDTLVNLRSTLKAEYDAGRVRFGAELWDSRIGGANARTPISTGEVNTLELVQAYAAANIALPGRTAATVQVGRFVLNLGSRRLVAADDYRNTTNGYTGVRVDLALRSGVRANLIYVLPQVRLPDDVPALRDSRSRADRASFDLVLWGGVASKAGLVGDVMGEASFMHLGERDSPGRPTRDRSLDTLGLRVMREPAPRRTDFEVEGFVQWGRASADLAAASARLPVAAWFLHADVGHSLATRWKPRLSVDFDIASGDRPGGRLTRFDTLFGMRRADLAPAGLYNAIARTNLISPGVRLEVTPSRRIDGFASLRPFWSASASDAFSSTGVRDARGRSGRFAGTQIDGRLRYWLLPATLRFELDAVILAKGRLLRDAPNAPTGKVTRYLSANLTSTF